MSTDDVFDLLDHAIEPDPWFCDAPWEYRAMHWRPSERPVLDAGTLTASAQPGRIDLVDEQVDAEVGAV